MAELRIKLTDLAAPLRKAESTLKAAIVVSAAAVLSQSAGDRAANAAAAHGHFDDFAALLPALRGGMVPVALLSRPAGTDEIEIDAARLDTSMATISTRQGSAEQALRDVIARQTRDDIDVLAQRIGHLGRAFQHLASLVTGETDDTPFRFDQFFREAMQDLAQRDWSATDGA
ncbi:hypothetical protein RPMA_20980 [Tardiphaga alba]|uniref:Uncharacterized protein n=1 Tax=Tardiphaga alba TaxID=340268 RepID=A0ABX8AFE7_9BRAD|nr:hypothetical protein [Tardiphaga alba]QUS41040.1 hypothetical protein RPMA_20980 [Tardiphaga alba]